MKLTDQQRAEYTELAEDLESDGSGQAAASAYAIRALLADLEELEGDAKAVKEAIDWQVADRHRLEKELAATRKLVAARQLMEMKLHGEVLKMRDSAESYGPLGFEAAQAALQAVLVAMDEHEYGNTATLSAAIAEAVEPYKKLRDDMEAIAAGSPNIPFREFAMHALHDLDAALAAKRAEHG